MNPATAAHDGPGAAAQIQIQRQVLQRRVAGIADAAAAGLDLGDNHSAWGGDGDGPVLRPQAIDRDLAGARETQAEVAGVRTIEIGQGAGIAALAQIGDAAQANLADVGRGQRADEGDFKAIAAQRHHAQVVACQRWRAIGQGHRLHQGIFDVSGQRAARRIPADRGRDIAARAPGQGQGEAAAVGAAQVDHLGLVESAGGDAGIDPGHLQLLQTDRCGALQRQGGGRQGLAGVARGGRFGHLPHRTGLQGQGGGAEQAHLERIAVVGDQADVATGVARAGQGLRDLHVAGAEYGDRPAGRLQAADGHVAEGQQIDPPAERAGGAEVVGLHQEGTLVLRIAADLIPGRQHDRLRPQGRTALAVAGDGQWRDRGLCVVQAAAGRIERDAGAHRLRLDPALRQADVALCGAGSQRDVATAGDQTRAERGAQTAQAAAAGAAGDLASRQSDVTDRKHIAGGAEVRAGAQADVVGGSHQALYLHGADHGGADVCIGAGQGGRGGGLAALRIAGRDHAGRVHAQVAPDLELHVATSADLAECGQGGVADQLALDGQVPAGQHQRILAGRDAAGEQGVALAQDVDLASRHAVGPEGASTLRTAFRAQALGDGFGAVFGGGHILVEGDLGDRGNLGLDLIGAELDLIGVQIGDRAGPVVVQGGAAVADGRALADPVVAVDVEGLVDIGGCSRAGARVVVLGCNRSEVANSVLTGDGGGVGDKGRRRHIVLAAPAVAGVGTLPRPGRCVGDDAG